MPMLRGKAITISGLVTIILLCIIIIPNIMTGMMTSNNPSDKYGPGVMPNPGFYDLYNEPNNSNSYSLIKGYVGFNINNNNLVIQYMAKDNVNTGWFQIPYKMAAIEVKGSKYPHMQITVNNSVNIYLPSHSTISICGTQPDGKSSVLACGSNFTNAYNDPAGLSEYNLFIQRVMHKQR